MDLREVLCRAWIDCDPNRAGNEPGSGFHPDDTIERGWMGGSGMAAVQLPATKLTGQPRWKWFEPRAVALEEYLDRHGYMIVAKPS